jgi:hypothetical protein
MDLSPGRHMNNGLARRRITVVGATALLMLLGVEAPVAGQQAPTYPTQAYPAQATPAYPNATDPNYPSQPVQPAQGYPPQGTYPAQAPGGYPTQPAPGYPGQATPGYPTQGAPAAYPNQAPQAYAQPPAPPRPPSAVRNFFVSTLAAVASFTGPGVARVIGEALVGGIANWFSHGRQQQPQAAYGGSAYSSPAYGSSGYDTSSSYGSSTYGSTTGSYGTTQGAYAQGGYSTAPQAYGSTQGTYPQPSAYPQSSYPQSSYPQSAATQGAYPQSAYPSTTPGYGAAGTTTYPQAASTGAYGATGTATYPQVASAGTYAANGTYGAAGTYPPVAGTYAANGASAYRDAPMSGAEASSSVYAGVAYEVHLVDPAGRATPVDPNTYAFHSGDRFVVLYRPSLPGLMEVFNVNAAGKQTKIDNARMAAGQLATLGPYQFSGAAADESLQILLTPCSTPELVTATRDIVNVSAAGASAGQPAPGLKLATCGTTTRGMLQTRDIQKVGVDGTTTYALDPVSTPELANGQAVTRRVTINFRHR